MAELRPAGQTKGQEGTAQAVEAGTGILGRAIGMLPGCVGVGSGGSRLNLARDAKSNKQGFCRHVSQKRKVKESVHTHPLPMNKNGDLISTGEEKAEVLHNCFLSQSPLATSLLAPPESMGYKMRTRGVKPFPL